MLTVSASVLATVVPKTPKRISRPVLLKTLSHRLGVFFGLCFFVQIALGADCGPSGSPQWAQLDHVIDGDTLKLGDGRKVRLLGVNAPELAHGAAAQPLAVAARYAVADFFSSSPRIQLVVGNPPSDRYGRMLAAVFRHDGVSVEDFLLAEGLAFQVVVPPNVARLGCLQAAEARARQARRGVWGIPYFKPRPASQLLASDAGFALVQGRIESVARGRDGWWLTMGQLALHLADQDMIYFPGLDVDSLRGQQLTVRGWMIDRSQSKAVKAHHYAPMMMQIRHPAMWSVKSP